MSTKARIGLGSIPVGGPEQVIGPDLDELEGPRGRLDLAVRLVSSRHTVDPLIGLAYAA
ncbi:MAG: hypothetical protein H0V92_07605, partial [Pseudonocardiales bacterium]|nr:hypothetical protein [Pseudonocardiales bacterium]